jgi:nitrogen fixation protein FixH
MSLEKKERNFWPIGLLIFGIIFCICVISMIFVAMNNKWEQDQSFMSEYKKVDKNYDNIARSQKAFDANYDVEFDKSAFKLGENIIKLSIKDKNGTFVQNAVINAIITRPDTNQYNQKLDNFKINDKEYQSNAFTLDKIGRWITEYKIDINQTVGFFKIERQIPRQ